MKFNLFISFFLLVSFSRAWGFCGFYVAKADANLYNKASQVVLVRDENKTVLSMMNDYEGDLKKFAMVVPVPTVLKKGQIHVGNSSLFSHIDSFTAPRLVEYFDSDPCAAQKMFLMKNSAMDFAEMATGGPEMAKGKRLGVKVEAEYTVGEYDIVILSAKESNGLETWLIEQGYNIPKGAHEALAPYIKQKLKFFVAKVNLEEQAKTGLSKLRPLQFAFESEKFMLPIRLGMINAKGPQELLVYVVTKNGRVETTNYRTVKLPTGMDIPVFVKNEFGDFYKSMFDTQVKKEDMRAVFTEHFWDMSWCDPCAADPMSSEELRELGVFWLPGQDGQRTKMSQSMGGVSQVKVTRLHLRYTKEKFPEDLLFQETKDTENFQGRYVLRHRWSGNKDKCSEAKVYLDGLPKLYEVEAKNLASLTGWEINSIRKKMNFEAPSESNSKSSHQSWWEKIWGK